MPPEIVIVVCARATFFLNESSYYDDVTSFHIFFGLCSTRTYHVILLEARLHTARRLSHDFIYLLCLTNDDKKSTYLLENKMRFYEFTLKY